MITQRSRSETVRLLNNPNLEKLLGTIVNAFSIVIGSLIGLFLKGNIPEKYSKTIINGIGKPVDFVVISTYSDPLGK